MSYGLAYGLSAFGLSGQLKISVDEAEEQMEEYFARFGGVRDYLRRRGRAGQRPTGYTETVFGRRRYVPDLTSDNRQQREMAERMALNAPIQGSRRGHHQGGDAAGDSALREAGTAVADAAAGARRAGLRGGAGEQEAAHRAGPGADGRRLPAWPCRLEVSVGRAGRDWDAAAPLTPTPSALRSGARSHRQPGSAR